MLDHLLVLQDSEDHPEKAGDGRGNGVDKEEHEDLAEGDPAADLTLDVCCHQVQDVEEGGGVVHRDNYHHFLPETSKHI